MRSQRMHSAHGMSSRALLAVALLCGAASAQVLEVKTVPWRGDPTQPHQVYSGATLTLQGVALPAPGCPLTSAVWDPGDGSAPVSVSVGNPRVLELNYAYTGVNNQPYTATLTVTDSCGTQKSDTFRVVVLAQSLDVEVDMAIDRGLWNLHKRQTLSSVGGVPTGYWSAQSSAAATASAVQAMEIHGHLPTGNGAEDPYVDDVQRGLAHLMTELQPVAIAAQPYGNPDVNGNGIGLQAPYAGSAIYVGGQVIDAIVASNAPNLVASTGPSPEVLGKTYATIVQDMIDMYSWGQSENSWARGGWRYSFNADADNSACQWMAIGGIAAERVFGSVVPQFVKDENLNYWLAYSQYRDGSFAGSDGHFGYSGQFSNVDVAMMNTTPSGIVQLVLADIPSSDPRFDAAQAYMVRNWNTLTLNNRIYGMFAAAKAMRLAVPTPVQTLHSGSTSFDWYRAQTALGDPVDGLARRLVNLQQGDGSWDGYWVVDDIATAWSTIVLSSTIVSVGPVAICKADPENTAATFPVSFSGAFSYHPDANRSIVNYEWDFESDGTFDATGLGVIHSYPTQGVYNVTLRVTDDTQPVPLQSTSSCQVSITPPPFPPNSNPGGPYEFCPAYQPWILDGTGSSDPDGSVVLYEWDFSPQPPLNFSDATGPTVDATSYFLALGPGVYDIALRVTDDAGGSNVDFSVVRVLSPNDPCSGAPAVLNCPPDFTEIWAGGIPVGQADPSHTGTATYTDNCTLGIQLGYTDISVVPNTPQNPGAPEVVITRRWSLTDGCGSSLSCDQTITLLSPGGQGGALTLDMQPNSCPNEIGPSTPYFDITIPGTWRNSAMDIDPSTVLVRRADRVGLPLKLGQYLTSFAYVDVTAPYYGQNGPCEALGADGHLDLTLRANARALRSRFKLGSLPDGQLVTVIVTAKTYMGESLSLTDWITVRR
ncbi:MAG: PKD domain-containing protein [Planctomycetes bacterium]|nr:PKD domain-containing protein [Planctomycetota bacterium]